MMGWGLKMRAVIGQSGQREAPEIFLVFLFNSPRQLGYVRGDRADVLRFKPEGNLNVNGISHSLLTLQCGRLPLPYLGNQQLYFWKTCLTVK